MRLPYVLSPCPASGPASPVFPLPFLSCPVLSLFSSPPPLLLFAPKPPNKKSFRTFSSSRRKQPSASDLRFYFRREIARVRYLPSASALPRLFFERVSKKRGRSFINNFSIVSKLRANYSKTNLENVNFFSRKISISISRNVCISRE